MAEAIIEKLKIKPQAQRPVPVEFKIGQQNRLEIQDNRKESALNREKILEKIKNIKKVKTVDNKLEEPSKVKIKNTRKKTTVIDDTSGDKVGKVRKIKKVKGKTLVLGIKKDTISELGRLKERRTQAPDLKVIAEERVEGDFEEKKLDLSGLPAPSKRVNIIASQYYLNNRKKFINFINGLYDTYRKDIIKKQEEPQVPQDHCRHVLGWTGRA